MAFWDKLPIVGDVIDSVLGYQSAKHAPRRQLRAQLDYAPAIHDEQLRQRSKEWVGEGAVGPQVLGGQVGASFDALRKQGATVPEILGQGGGPASQPSGVLGNGPAMARASAAAYQARARWTEIAANMKLAREQMASNERIADKQFGAGSPAARGAGVQEGRLELERAMAPIQREIASNQAVTSSVRFKIAEVLARMGPDNVMSLLSTEIMRAEGQDIRRLFMGDGPVNVQLVDKWLQRLVAIRSTTRREALGVADLIGMLFGRGGEQHVPAPRQRSSGVGPPATLGRRDGPIPGLRNF